MKVYECPNCGGKLNDEYHAQPCICINRWGDRIGFEWKDQRADAVVVEALRREKMLRDR